MASGLEHELAEWHRKLKALKASKRAGEAERKRVLDTQRGHIEHEKALNKSMQEQLSIDLEVRGAAGTGCAGSWRRVRDARSLLLPAQTTSSPNQAHQERTDKLLDLVETYSRKVGHARAHACGALLCAVRTHTTHAGAIAHSCAAPCAAQIDVESRQLESIQQELEVSQAKVRGACAQATALWLCCGPVA